MPVSHPKALQVYAALRETERCDFCHDHEAHSGKKTAKAWIHELHTVYTDALPRDERGRIVTAARMHTSNSESHSPPDDEYVGKFFPQLLNSEV